jgi:hypothetical protein
MAIYCVSEKNPDRASAYDCAPWIFFASLHLTILEQAANFEFCEQSDRILTDQIRWT